MSCAQPFRPPKEQPPRNLSGKVDRLDIKRWKAGLRVDDCIGATGERPCRRSKSCVSGEAQDQSLRP